MRGIIIVLWWAVTILPLYGTDYEIGEKRSFSSLEDNNTLPGTEHTTMNDPVQSPASDSLTRFQNEIHSLSEKIINEGRFINKLNALSQLEYPVGIGSSTNPNYSIMLKGDEITPGGSVLTAGMSFEIPSNGQRIAFGGMIPLSAEGGINGEVKLDLLGDVPIQFGPNITLHLIGGGDTYVLMGCDGFISMTISARIEFSNELFLAENPATGELTGEPMVSYFQTTLYDWNDMIIDISMLPFQVKGLNGVGFDIQSAVLDFSDFQNPAGVEFPEEYPTTQFLEGNRNLWRGIYIQQASVRMPPEFQQTTSNERLTFNGRNFIIDKLGFSGIASIENLLTLEQGDLGGWAFSVEHFAVDVRLNQIASAGFSGKMRVPALENPLDYTALINTGGDYVFTAATSGKETLSMWAAEAEIYKNSIIAVEVLNGEFRPSAMLHGKMDIHAGFADNQDQNSDTDKGVSLADIEFQSLHIRTVAPYLSIGAVSLGSEQAEQAMAGFPLAIANIGVEERAGNELGLYFDVIMQLTNDGDGGFGADGSFVLVSERHTENNRSQWRYKDLEVQEAYVDIDGGAFSLEGHVIFFKENPEFGNGFQGSLNAEFTPGLQVQAVAMFGKKDNLRYWFADAMANFGQGLPVFTGFGLYGFGGGAYYHMKQDGYAPAGGNGIGQSLSGIQYKPDKNTHLGIMASVTVGTHPSREAFNGDATFEIAFNNRGGVRFIAFRGTGAFMTPPIPDQAGKIAEQSQKMIESGGEAPAHTAGPAAQVWANMQISYDFQNRELHGNLEVYANIAGGLMKGVGEQGKAGWAVLHFDPQDWYVYIGTPDKPVGISLMEIFSTQSYFMVGTKILDSPPPPANVSEILGGIDLNYMDDMNALGAGQGIAFGSRFAMETGDLTFLMFYANFAAGAGFDIMLKNYPSARCSGSTDPIGINGWYANGQVFAYMQGTIGIQVKIFRKEKKADILDIGAAAILQAKMPNPTWMKGAVGGRFSVFGGLVKGNCNFEFEIGEECELVGGSPLDNIDIIAQITPMDGEKKVDVFTAPQAIFNYAVNQEFQLVDAGNQKRSYRIKLDYFKVEGAGNTISGELQWNSDKKVVAFESIELLPGENELIAEASVVFEEKVNGQWQPVEEDGETLTEKLSVKFNTDKAPDYIPQSNVAYSYPTINQYNYYKDESSVGYLKTAKGQSYLFNTTSEWVQVGRFISETTEKVHEFDFTYDAESMEVSFTRPNGLKTGDIYQFQLVNVPARKYAMDENVDSVVTAVNTDNSGNDLSVKTQKAESTYKALEEKVIYSAYFRTSNYRTFKAKLQPYKSETANIWPLRVNVEKLWLTVNYYEEFDRFEVAGTNDQLPMVRGEAILSNNTWYNSYIKPLLYKDYPINESLTIENRDPEKLGVPPVRAIGFTQSQPLNTLNPEDIQQQFTSRTLRYVSIDYLLSHYMDHDLKELQQKIATQFYKDQVQVDDEERLKEILNGDLKLLVRGSYVFKLSYYLPGKNIKTSDTNLTIRY